jgi:glycosyltransferase involved in cell wall biosynthesis
MITLAIPSYNRSDYVIESFLGVVSDNRITEILVIDDCSDQEIYDNLLNLIECLKISELKGFFHKIKILRNEKNLGSFGNKLRCVEESKNDWVILLDSDNSIDTSYINSIENKREEKTIYTPVHAICNSSHLDYTKYSGFSMDKNSYSKNIPRKEDPMLGSILNTGNYFFYKKNYLLAVRTESSILNSFAADAFYLIYLWMKNIDGAKIQVVENMRYKHRLHEGSHWINNSNASNLFVDEIIEKIRTWI